MRRIIALALIMMAVIVASPASAHYGDRWFTTAYKAQREIVGKYPRVFAARCKPIPAEDRDRYPAHSQINEATRARVWDHFRCGIWTRKTWASDNGCWSVYHATGQRWGQFIMTSYYYSGCSPSVFGR
jgi:hypothetical protein